MGWSSEQEPERSGYSGPADDIVATIEESLHKADYDPDSSGWEHLRVLSEEALSLDPRCHSALVVLGVYHFERREYGMMEDRFIEALKVVENPFNGFTGPWPSWMFVTLIDGMTANEGSVDEGIVERVSERQFEAALRYHRNVLEADPRIRTLKPIVENLMKNGMGSEALAEIDAYLVKHPEDRMTLRYRKKVERKVK
jgi:hypothetical protein